MYFALGLLTAGLVALMIAPAVWRRAVRLTRTRIESSVPLTLSEIQADKDQLRAEFAMSTRRLEMSIDRLKDRAQEQLIELNRKREQVNKLTELRSGKVDDLKELEEREAALRARLAEKEDSHQRATAELRALEDKVAERTKVLARLEVSLEEARIVADEQKVELVARDTEIENLRDALAATKAGLSAASVERASLDASTTEMRATLAREQRAADELRHRVAAQDQELEIRGEELARRRAEIAQLQKDLTAETATKESIESELVQAEAARIEAESEVTELSLRLAAEPPSAIGDNVSKAMASVQAEKDALAARVGQLEEDREKLAAENAELRRVAGEEWEQERMETAMLRERLNDIAAEVVRLTNTMEGPLASVAEGATNVTELARAAPRRAGNGSTAAPEAEETPAPAEPAPARQTLAERIRALQHGASGNS